MNKLRHDGVSPKYSELLITLMLGAIQQLRLSFPNPLRLQNHSDEI